MVGGEGDGDDDREEVAAVKEEVVARGVGAVEEKAVFQGKDCSAIGCMHAMLICFAVILGIFAIEKLSMRYESPYWRGIAARRIQVCHQRLHIRYHCLIAAATTTLTVAAHRRVVIASSLILSSLHLLAVEKQTLNQHHHVVTNSFNSSVTPNFSRSTTFATVASVSDDASTKDNSAATRNLGTTNVAM
ncbi:hypothetical protein TEA_028140 [Camellia sinensis var. sinensis]|uniref:Uncharacterized protein n=1 Tax=Camellia sinensis var. sinensis TaxID=542762 RepID=A0A4S4E2I3_CAMSN|nr:hypothetical protein TEA_028140 [Camellia sinensis var. sinensis]